jgi:transposase
VITIDFTEDAKEKLHQERYKSKHPRVQQKMEALYLKSMGLGTGEICRLCRITRSALAGHLKTYRDGGIEKLKEWKCHGGRKSGLSRHTESIAEEFKRKPPHSIGEAIARIEVLTGVLRTPTSVKLFLKNIGMKFRKVGSAPKGADTPVKQEEQEVFCKKNSIPGSKRPGKGGAWCFS